MNNWQDLASTHSLQSLCEMAVRSIELQAQVRKLQAELAELKASIPQIKHDAIIDAVREVNHYPDRYGDWVVCTDDLYYQARQLLTKAVTGDVNDG